MTARLMVREVGQREFAQHNGDFADSTTAHAEGERLTIEGNVEAFQVWELHSAMQRVWKLEAIGDA